jgi:predicted flavoprotein YhiN
MRLTFILLLAFCFGANAAVIDLKGIITNDKNEPLSGATVAVKGSKQITTTNNSGDFTLKGLNGNATLIISSIGYETQRVSVNGLTQISIHLLPAVSQLDEALVIGYGTSSKRLNTGSVTKVSGDAIAELPV